MAKIEVSRCRNLAILLRVFVKLFCFGVTNLWDRFARFIGIRLRPVARKVDGIFILPFLAIGMSPLNA